eukprot:758317-Hanusia_phi.AAC.11
MPQWEQAMDVLEWMQDAGIQLNIRMYSAIVHVCGQAGRLDHAFRILEECKRDGIKPNVIMYTALIHACKVSALLVFSSPRRSRLLCGWRSRSRLPRARADEGGSRAPQPRHLQCPAGHLRSGWQLFLCLPSSWPPPGLHTASEGIRRDELLKEGKEGEESWVRKNSI